MQTDVVIIGAGAAGLMCAIEAAKRGRKVVVLEHANKPGKKILMSGGGRCNFTNYSIEADNYLSDNPHFCKSALKRYTQWDFIALLDRYQIAWHEKVHGQLFCDHSAKDILNMLLAECDKAGAQIRLNCQVRQVRKPATDEQEQHGPFVIETSDGNLKAQSLVIASGGLSIPKMCATPFGYQLAEQFGHPIKPTRAALVPFTLQPEDKQRYADLTGISVDAIASNTRCQFRENILFTHRGLSGPAILQISSYWRAGEAISINLLPDHDLKAYLKQQQTQRPQSKLKTQMGELLPKRLVSTLLDEQLLDKPLQTLSHERLGEIAEQLQNWQVRPGGTEGYRTAEVTLGGVDCDSLSSQTMESRHVPGLYFIGEVVDVTGWLGGYNFQWAWSSGWAAGQVA